jgi:hypothetical protein
MSFLVFGVFFLVVLVVSVRCKRSIAYGTGFLAAASYGFLFWSTTQLLLEAFLLLASSVLVSDLLSAQRQQFLVAQEQQQRSDRELEKVQRSYRAALEINSMLEQQIAGQTLSIATISERVAHIWKSQTDERFTAIVDLIVYALEASSCSLYIQHGSQMHLYAAYPVVSAPPVVDLTQPLIKRVMASCQVSTVHDLLAEEKSVMQDMPVMAGPLLDSGGRIVGIVVVGNLPLLKFAPGTIRLFSSLLQFVSIALYTSFSNHQIDIDELISIHTKGKFEEESSYQLQEMM